MWANVLFIEQKEVYMQRDLCNLVKTCESVLQRIDKRIERGVDIDMSEYREDVCRLLEKTKERLDR